MPLSLSLAFGPTGRRASTLRERAHDLNLIPSWAAGWRGSVGGAQPSSVDHTVGASPACRELGSWVEAGQEVSMGQKKRSHKKVVQASRRGRRSVTPDLSSDEAAYAALEAQLQAMPEDGL